MTLLASFAQLVALSSVTLSFFLLLKNSSTQILQEGPLVRFEGRHSPHEPSVRAPMRRKNGTSYLWAKSLIFSTLNDLDHSSLCHILLLVRKSSHHQDPYPSSVRQVASFLNCTHDHDVYAVVSSETVPR